MSSRLRINLIAAIANHGVIGHGQSIPWRLPEDLKHFARTTRGHVLITGRKNLEAMGGPLPGRVHIVLSREPGWQPGKHLRAGDVIVAASWPEALSHAERRQVSEVFVIGGAEVYALALPFADVFYRTRVLATVPGDVVFPAYDEQEWEPQVLFSRAAQPDSAGATMGDGGAAVPSPAFVVERLVRRHAPRDYRELVSR